MQKSRKNSQNFLNILILVLINFVVFYNYWIGRSTPPWDFLGGGQVEQFRFYRDGGFFNPPSWFPYAWFGIPEYQMLQDGGWFFPVAIVSEIFYWNPPNAARVQAFLILIGSIGAFYLAKNYVKDPKIALLAGTLYSFIPAFYSNAQHYGVVRSASLLPWVLFVVNPNFLLKNKFSIFIGSFVLFQTIVGSYPGNLVSIFYTTLIYCFFYLFFSNVNKLNYLINLLIMSFSGILMGLLRYLPVVTNINSFPANPGNQAGISIDNLVYLLFPYADNNLPWGDPSLRSIYIGSLVFVLAFFINFRNRFLNLWIVLLFFSILMMMQNQINNFLREIIPLSDISRFAISDWRNTFNLALILISVITLENILAKKLSISNLKIIFITIGFFYMLYLGYRYEFSLLKILFYSIPVILILLYLLFFLKTWHIKPLIIFTICFNYLFVIDNSLSWLTTVKEQYFNIYKKDYSVIKETIIYPLEKRSKRFFFIDPPLTSDEYKSDQRYNRFWLTGGFGALGYHNIKDIPEYRSLFPRLERPNDPLIKFLTLEGKQLILTGQQQSENLLSDCVNKSTCNFDPQIQVKQLEFNKQSEIFKINSNKEFRMIQNEMYSPVWTGQLCEADSKCLELKPYASFESLRSWNLPKGEYIFKTTAQTPLNKERWVLFSIGLLISLSNLGMKLFNYRGPNIKSKNISS